MNRTEAKSRIEALRKRMIDLYLQSGSLSSLQVIEASQQLDEALNRYSRFMKVK